MGVRGIALAEGDKVISLSILRHVDATADERAAYLKRASAVRRGADGDEAEAARPTPRRRTSATRSSSASSAMSRCRRPSSSCSPCRNAASASAPRPTNTGSPAAAAKASSPCRSTAARPARSSASFPVEESDQIMLVTDGGQLIRCPVDGIRIAGRSTQGVIVFNTAEGERVVSVERLSEEGDDNGG